MIRIQETLLEVIPTLILTESIWEVPHYMGTSAFPWSRKMKKTLETTNQPCLKWPLLRGNIVHGYSRWFFSWSDAETSKKKGRMRAFWDDAEDFNLHFFIFQYEFNPHFSSAIFGPTHPHSKKSQEADPCSTEGFTKNWPVMGQSLGRAARRAGGQLEAAMESDLRMTVLVIIRNNA